MNKCINPIPFKLDHIISAKFQKTKSDFPQSVHQTQHPAMEFSSHKKHTHSEISNVALKTIQTPIYSGRFCCCWGGSTPRYSLVKFLVINLERPKEQLTSKIETLPRFSSSLPSTSTLTLLEQFTHWCIFFSLQMITKSVARDLICFNSHFSQNPYRTGSGTPGNISSWKLKSLPPQKPVFLANYLIQCTDKEYMHRLNTQL